MNFQLLLSLIVAFNLIYALVRPIKNRVVDNQADVLEIQGGDDVDSATLVELRRRQVGVRSWQLVAPGFLAGLMPLGVPWLISIVFY